ncbi:MAG: hypothetical protein LAT82_04555 [Nanoarchaeota archaeon]|nr:hypothetical protein [Nanoarchaeota archaeon]
MQTQKDPFQVVNLQDFSSKQHLGTLLSNFKLQETNEPNSDLELRVFRFLDTNSTCTNCNYNSSRKAIIMGDFYERDEKTGLWKPQKKEFIFYQPMLTSSAFREKYQNLEPSTILEVYQLPEDFWEKYTSNYIQSLKEQEKYEEMYSQALYKIVTTTPPTNNFIN